MGVTGYKVERCTGSGCSNYSQIATPSGTGYSDTGLSTATTYQYRVRATDAAGNLSGYSSVASAATLDGQVPTTPTSLSATAASGAQINLSWAASTDDVGVTGYRVERCTGAGCSSFAQIATPTGTTFSNTGLASSTTYRYRIRAADGAGNLSGYSSVVSATTSGGNETITYTYDALGRLVGVIHTGGANNNIQETYTFDAAGNRTNVTVTTP